MEITQTDDGKKGEFIAQEGTVRIGEIVYNWAGPSKFIIEHTEVDPAYKGQGVGKKLVMAAVEFARKKKVKIMPLCPYAKSVFDRTPEISDVLF